MGQRYRNRVISATGPVLGVNSASGIWALDSVAQQVAVGNWVFFPFSVQYIIVAGGGGGAASTNTGGGGGGAGGYRASIIGESSGGGSSAEPLFYPQIGVSYSVVVGAGGAAYSQGGSSSFSEITSIGGGNGSLRANAGSGGSGGGAMGGTGGAGTSGQGYSGGNGGEAGAGGGAAQAGQNSQAGGYGGNGGNGIASSVTGTSVYRGGGGAGCGYSSSLSGAAGLGGGGRNANGSPNTGGGAGGRYGSDAGYTGGSGVVIIKSPVAAASTTGSPTVTTVGMYIAYTFNGSGTITF